MDPFAPGPAPHPADAPDQDPRPRTATPAVLRRAEALGFVPGDGNVLLWALAEVERLRETATEPPPLACETHTDWSADDLRDLAAMWEALREAAAAKVTFCPRVELFSDGSGRLVGEVDAVYAEWDRLPDAAPAIRAAIAEGGGR